MLAHAHSRTLCSCKMCIDPLGDHVLTCKQHTGSICGHKNLMDVVASLSRDSKIGPVRVNHKVSTTGDATRKQGDVEISNFPISLRDGLVIDVSFVCEIKGRSRASLALFLASLRFCVHYCIDHDTVQKKNPRFAQFFCCDVHNRLENDLETNNNKQMYLI